MSTPPSNDSDLRSLFDDAVSDVEPRSGLDRIQARTATRTRRPWGPTRRAPGAGRGRAPSPPHT